MVTDSNTPLSLVSVTRSDRFLFAPIDACVAAAFRIALAAMIAWAFVSVGMRPSAPLLALPGMAWGYEHVFLTRGYAIAVFGCCGLLMLGWRPRPMCVVLLLMLIPLTSLTRGRQSRQVLWFTLLAFAFVRSGVAWSVEAFRRFDADGSRVAGPIWPVRLIQLQLSLLYAVNAIVKTHPDYLSGDTLIAMSMMRSNFNVDLSGGFVDLGPLHLPVMFAAIATVLTEAFLAIAFWLRRLRWIAVAVGVGFHVGLMFVVNIWMLDWASMFLYTAFVLPWCCVATRNGKPEDGQRPLAREK